MQEKFLRSIVSRTHSAGYCSRGHVMLDVYGVPTKRDQSAKVRPYHSVATTRVLGRLLEIGAISEKAVGVYVATEKGIELAASTGSRKKRRC